MEKLFELTDRYMERSDWTDLALIKFCLCSMGIIIGMNIPKKKSEKVAVFSCGVFISTYIVLMAKVVSIAKEMARKETV